MKKTLLTFSVFLAIACCTLVFASNSEGGWMNVAPVTSSTTTSSEDEPQHYGRSIGTIEAVSTDYNSFSGDYRCALSDNTTMYFCIDENYGKAARLTAIYTSENSIIIPDSIRFVSSNGGAIGTYPVTIISDYYDRIGYNRQYNPFPSYLTTITLPPTIKEYRSYNPSQPVDQNVETVYLLGGALSLTNANKICAKYAYVCNKSYLSSVLSNNFYSNAEILPYGWEFTSATVNVNKNGEFAESYLTQNDYDWGTVQNLKVTGNINSTDLNAIKNLASLMKLDISETSISEIPDNYMGGRYSLTEVKLPSVAKIGNSAFYNCKRLQYISSLFTQEIGTEAFSGCCSLKKIDLKDVELINENAFKGCASFDSIDLSKAKFIGYSAFSGCASLKSARLDSAIVIGHTSLSQASNQNLGEAFRDCSSLSSITFGNNLRKIHKASFLNTSIESVVIPEGVDVISESVFAGCANLEMATLPNTIKSISENAFSSCISLANMELPSGLTDIGAYAFYGCSSLKKITIPATIKTIGGLAFYDSGLSEMVCFASIPPIIPPICVYDRYGYPQYYQYPVAGGEGMDMNRAVLYVPPFSKSSYRNDDNWNIFNIMRPIDVEIDYICINDKLDFELEKDYCDIITNKTTMSLDRRYTEAIDDYTVGQLSTYGDESLSVGEFSVSGVLSQRSQMLSQYCPTFINHIEKMRADNVKLNLSFLNQSAEEWHFISLPFDVKVSDIVPGDNTYWVIRRYDSAARGVGDSSETWVNLCNDDTMEAGKGYIISSIDGNAVDYYGRYHPHNCLFTFTSKNTLSKNNIFRSTDIVVPLTEYASEFAHNRSWNLIGNPYPCYFDMHYLNEEFTAPITIWNGSSYVAYSPVDDNLVLSPYEAFFVQCPLDANEMIFKEAGRLHSNDGNPSYYAAYTPSRSSEIIAPEERTVFNFVLTGENSEDRTRIVFNADAKMEYEIGRDASKFFAEGSSAQIYVASDVNYSICERPVCDGNAVLGLRAFEDKTYTLSLSGHYCSDWHVMVTDNVTGTTVDLTESDYEFTAVAGDSGTRFSVKFELGNHSGIESVIADFGNDANVTVTAINGVTVYNGRLSEINVPSAGLYIVSNGQLTRKAILK